MEEQVAVKKTKPFFRYDPVTSILLLLLIFFSSQIIAGFLISLYPAVQSWTETEATAWLRGSVMAQFGYIAIAEVLAISLVLKALQYARVLRQRIGLVKPRFKDVGWAFVAYGLYFLCYIVVVTVVTNIFSGIDTQQEQQIGFETARTNGQLLLTFLALVVLVPIAEEVMFRGFLFSSLRAKFAFWPAAIVTSVLFGIAHLQFGADAPLLWIAAIDTFVLSCFLCYLREEHRSIWPPIFLHGIKNCLAFVLLFGPRFLW